MNRPELASQRAVVQATLELLRQERFRPLIPSVVLAGRGPDGLFTNGYYGGGQGGNLNTWGGQAEFDAGLVWTLRNLGVGNRALVHGRAADREKALIELFNLQDRVAEEVVQAHAQVEGAREGIPEAETGGEGSRHHVHRHAQGLGADSRRRQPAPTRQPSTGSRGGPPTIEPGLRSVLHRGQQLQPGASFNSITHWVILRGSLSGNGGWAISRQSTPVARRKWARFPACHLAPGLLPQRNKSHPAANYRLLIRRRSRHAEHCLFQQLPQHSQRVHLLNASC